jgi:hypothetical protein
MGQLLSGNSTITPTLSYIEWDLLSPHHGVFSVRGWRRRYLEMKTSCKGIEYIDAADKGWSYSFTDETLMGVLLV